MEYATEQKLNEQINKSKKSKKLDKNQHSWATIEHHSETEILSVILNLKVSKSFLESLVNLAQVSNENPKLLQRFFQGERQKYTHIQRAKNQGILGIK